MRQSSNNTFNEGLNFDLNPITTPNNVLTDALNASFVTFNGDELALQNDAGNTKISVAHTGATLYNPSGTYSIGDKVYTENPTTYYKNLTGNNTSLTTDWYDITYVRLSKNFYPIGMKEYGGVLYIVSTNDLTGEIEFGSYPSPEYQTNEMDEGILLMYDETIPDPTNDYYQDILYRPTTINNTEFKTGRYISFDLKNTLGNEDDCDLSYITDFFEKKFYIVKLWQLLSNGYLNLTNDAWLKYETYRQDIQDPIDIQEYWFNDPNFKYYCPSQYKGKLAISLEIEPLQEFKLVSTPTLTYDGTSVGSEYTYTINVNAAGNGFMSVPSIYVSIWVDEVLIHTETVTPISDNLFTFDISLDEALYKDKVLRYEIEPDLAAGYYVYQHSDSTYLEIPEQWRNQYLITGQRLVTTLFDKVKFVISSANCADNYFEIIKIVDNNNIAINNDLEVSIDGDYVFIVDGTTTTDNLIAKYNVVDGKPVVIRPTTLAIDEDVIASLENTSIATTNADCGRARVTINFNIPLDMTDITDLIEVVDLVQGTSVTATSISTDKKQVIFDVDTGVSFTLTIGQNGTKTWDGYHDGSYTRTITSDTTINHAFISKFYLATPYTDGTLAEGTNVMWQAGYNAFDTLGIKVHGFTREMVFNSTTNMYLSPEIATTPGFTTTVEVLGATILNNTWSNITTNSDFRQIVVGADKYIFANKYSDAPSGVLTTHVLDTKDLIILSDGNTPMSTEMGYNSERQLTALHSVPVTWSITSGGTRASIVDGLITTTDVDGPFTARVEVSSHVYDEITINNSFLITNDISIEWYAPEIDISQTETVHLAAEGTTNNVTWEIISGLEELIDGTDQYHPYIVGTNLGTTVVRVTDNTTTAYCEIIINTIP